MCAAHCAGVVVMDAQAAFETSVSNGAIPSTPPFTLTVSASCSQRGEGAGMLGPAGTQSGPTSWCKRRKAHLRSHLLVHGSQAFTVPRKRVTSGKCFLFEASHARETLDVPQNA